jgi:hypothetical protein
MENYGDPPPNQYYPEEPYISSSDSENDLFKKFPVSSSESESETKQVIPKRHLKRGVRRTLKRYANAGIEAVNSLSKTRRRLNQNADDRRVQAREDIKYARRLPDLRNFQALATYGQSELDQRGIYKSLLQKIGTNGNTVYDNMMKDPIEPPKIELVRDFVNLNFLENIYIIVVRLDDGKEVRIPVTAYLVDSVIQSDDDMSVWYQLTDISLFPYEMIDGKLAALPTYARNVLDLDKMKDNIGIIEDIQWHFPHIEEVIDEAEETVRHRFIWNKNIANRLAKEAILKNLKQIAEEEIKRKLLQYEEFGLYKYNLETGTKENLKAQEDKLSAIDGQSNQLRLQGKSEKDILRLKIAQSTEAIKAAEINLVNAKNTKNAQVAAAQRNFEFTKGLLNFLSLPVTAVLAAADALGKALGQNFGLLDKFTGGIAKLVFDPAQVAKDGDATIKEAEGTLNKLKEGKAASQIALQNIDKQGGKAANKDAETLRKEKEAAEKEAQLILAEANKKLKTEQEQELLNIAQAYAEKNKKLELAGIKDNGDLAAAEQKERKVVLDKYAKEAKDLKDKEDKDAKDKEAAFQKELNKITLETKLEGIVDENAKAREQLLASYVQQRLDIDVNENLTAEQKSSLKLALATKEKQALDALQLTEDKRLAAKEITDLDARIAKNNADLEIERNLLNEKDILLKDAYAKKLITEEQYTAGIDANAKARTEIDKQETEAKVRNAEIASQLLNTIADVLGKNTAAGKVAAIASTTIDTYLGAQKAYTSQLIPGDPSSPIRAAIAAGIAVVGGLKNVKSILAVKTPGGGGGGSVPSISAAAPIAPPQPQAQTTTLDNRSINAIGNQTTRAYVVESDVTGSQQRMAAIQQRARFG